MGVLRLLLAISIIEVHTESFLNLPILGADPAIWAFFCISGFLMALVLDKTYGYKPLPFYSNRFLRLYPAYLCAVLITGIAITVALSFGKNPMNEIVRAYANASGLSLFATFINGIPFGAEWTVFLAQGPNGIEWVEGYSKASDLGFTSLHDLLLVPQVWSLSVEAQFYLLAPFICRLSTPLVFLGAIGANLLCMYGAPWFKNAVGIQGGSTLFFFQAHYFFYGILAFKLYRRVNTAALEKILAKASPFILLLVLGVYFIGGRFMAGDHYVRQVYFLCFSFSLPFFFMAFRNVKWDRFIGDFTYPVYLIHFCVGEFLSSYFNSWLAELTLLLSMLLSLPIIYLLDPLFVKLRNSNRTRARNTESTPPFVSIEVGSPTVPTSSGPTS